MNYKNQSHPTYSDFNFKENHYTLKSEAGYFLLH
jgi:hypothetical protein